MKEKVRVVAMDLRGHGKSSTEDEIDMSIEVVDMLQFFEFLNFIVILFLSGN